MSRRHPAACFSPSRLRLPFVVLSLAGLTALLLLPTPAWAYGPRGFRTVIIDAGHGGIDRGGGPGQRIPEKPYTLDAARRLDRALRARGFRTVMTRNDDVFVTLRDRVAIANSYRDAIFVSVHYNSGAREGAHGYETYYYRSDSFGLASRLHRAQLASMNTEDRHVRRRGFYVIRNTAIPAVLCEGGFLTNGQESRIITSTSYREGWAVNIANAIAAQSREGDPGYLGSQPPVTSERLVRHSSGGGGRRHAHVSHGRSHRGRSSSARSSSRRRGSSSSSHHTPTKKRHRR